MVNFYSTKIGDTNPGTTSTERAYLGVAAALSENPDKFNTLSDIGRETTANYLYTGYKAYSNSLLANSKRGAQTWNEKGGIATSFATINVREVNGIPQLVVVPKRSPMSDSNPNAQAEAIVPLQVLTSRWNAATKAMSTVFGSDSDNDKEARQQLLLNAQKIASVYGGT